MVDIKIVTQLIVKHEAIKLFPYKDTVGKLTIGVGRNLDDNGISKKEALYLCMDDINTAILDLQEYLPYFNGLPANVQLVLIDMTFNMGIGNVLQFHNTLTYIKVGNYKAAADNMLNSLWARQVPARALEDSNILRAVRSLNTFSIKVTTVQKTKNIIANLLVRAITLLKRLEKKLRN
jgi:lysozyme